MWSWLVVVEWSQVKWNRVEQNRVETGEEEWRNWNFKKGGSWCVGDGKNWTEPNRTKANQTTVSWTELNRSKHHVDLQTRTSSQSRDHLSLCYSFKEVSGGRSVSDRRVFFFFCFFFFCFKEVSGGRSVIEGVYFFFFCFFFCFFFFCFFVFVVKTRYTENRMSLICFTMQKQRSMPLFKRK